MIQRIIGCGILLHIEQYRFAHRSFCRFYFRITRKIFFRKDLFLFFCQGRYASRLQDINLSVFYCPFDIHRMSVVFLNTDAFFYQCGHHFRIQYFLLSPLFRNRHFNGPLISGFIQDLFFFGTDELTDQLTVTVADILIRTHDTGNYCFTKTIRCIDMNVLRITCRIRRKHDTGRFTFDHLLDHNRQRHMPLIITCILPITQCTVSP